MWCADDCRDSFYIIVLHITRGTYFLISAGQTRTARRTLWTMTTRTRRARQELGGARVWAPLVLAEEEQEEKQEEEEGEEAPSPRDVELRGGEAGVLANTGSVKHRDYEF